MKKLQKQKECRDMLLSAAQDKKNRLNEEKQDELALDMKILEKSLQEPWEHTEEKAERKVRARSVPCEDAGQYLI